jgi:hypothetical protein
MAWHEARGLGGAGLGWAWRTAPPRHAAISCKRAVLPCKHASMQACKHASMQPCHVAILSCRHAVHVAMRSWSPPNDASWSPPNDASSPTISKHGPSKTLSPVTLEMRQNGGIEQPLAMIFTCLNLRKGG